MRESYSAYDSSKTDCVFLIRKAPSKDPPRQPSPDKTKGPLPYYADSCKVSRKP